MAAIFDEKKAQAWVDRILEMIDSKSLEPIVELYQLANAMGENSPMGEHLKGELTKYKESYNSTTKKVADQVLDHMRQYEQFSKLINNAEYKKHTMATDVSDAGEASYNMAKLL